MKRNWLSAVYVLFVLTALFLSDSRAGAQAVFGNIAGTVTDYSGAAIVGASVAIRDVDRGTEYHTVTKEQGGYEQGQLLAGPYTVEITAPGFTTFSSSVQVHVDSTVKLDASLKVGSGAATVQVTDQTPLLQTDRAEISTQLTTSEVDDLPLLGRNATGLAFTAPGTVLANFQVSDAENAQGGYQFATNGQQYFANGFLLDGTENNSAILGIAVINPNIDSLQEMKLTTSNYDAEFGSVAGTLIQATTKSGTNSFHGSAFE